MACALHACGVGVIFSVCCSVVIKVIPRCAFVGLWQVVRHFLTRGKSMRVALGNLNKVPHAIVRQYITGIRGPCIQRTKSACSDLRPGLSSHSLEQIV